MKQYAALDDTVYLWFAANDTSGSGGDGASPAADVRLAGAAADAAPVYSPTPTLLTHVNYSAGAHEIAIAATAANGFAANNTYAVFCTLLVDSQNPTGFVGSFDLKPVESNIIQIGDAAQSATDLKDFADTGYDPSAHRTQALIKATDDIDLSTTQKTSVNVEVATALVDIKLDHLINIAVDTNLETTVHDNSVLGYLLATSVVSGYARTTDASQAIRDRGDAAWVTGAGGSDRLLMVDTTIATLASQISFTLTAGSIDDDAYNNCTIVIEDASMATQKAVGLISNYVGITKTITLKYDPEIFTMAVSDKVYILAENALKATSANRQLNVAASGDIAGNIDGSVASLVGHTAQTGDNYVRLGQPAAASIAADLLAIDNFVDELESRLTATRAGYLDNLSTGAVALASVCTEARLAELAAANLPADTDAILADVIGINGDAMRGTDSAALASVCTEARLAELDAANIPADIDAIKAETDNLPSGLQKNVALSNFSFLMTDSTTNEPKTGLTVTVQISKDGGAFANATNTPATEIANGAYKIDLTQAERNADISILKATAVGANQTTLMLVSTT
jgi:hypothetical protein